MSDPIYVHLKISSDYSLEDGLCSPNKIIKDLVLKKMFGGAITDFNNLFGIIKFYNIAHMYGIKPIIGLEINLLSEILDNVLVKITLLAYNIQGYKNLFILVSEAYKKRKFRNSLVYITKKFLIKYRKGIIILSSGLDGEFGKILLQGNKEKIFNSLKFYKKFFFNTFYLEISRNKKNFEDVYIERVLYISEKYKIPVVATNNVKFLKKKDFYYHKIKVSINSGYRINDLDFHYDYNSSQYLKTESEMKSLFSDIPEAIQNTVEIFKKCNVLIDFNNYHLPKFRHSNIKKFFCEKSFLKKQVLKGFKFHFLKNLDHNNKNFKNIKEKYKNRIYKELNIINKMGFSGYFLIVMEFIQWAKKKNITVGPGRGSGAGSLVAYFLQITEIDPIKFDLLFERFLNPERVSMPDFDIDFCVEKRDLVIDHVVKLYGKNSVCQIITFGKMTARSVIRDVGRSLGYPYVFLNKISKLIPLDPGITIKNALLKSASLNDYYQNNSEVYEIFNTSMHLEGTIKNVGKHSGGIVISPGKITNFSPVYYDESNVFPITQFDKNDIEKIGLVKFDFLGLKTLTIINNCIKIIKKTKKISINKKINFLDSFFKDKKIFLMLQKVDNIAIFQLESYGMKKLIKKLQPINYSDLTALLALFRPGPLQSGMVDNFVNRKHKIEKIYYPDSRWEHKILKPILKDTYGIILYQEQVMKIVQKFSNYSLEEADLLRRAMSKKNSSEMSKHRLKFLKGAYKKKFDKILSIKLFSLLEKFSNYGFNKSHSVAYAFISYKTLWLKYYYTLEFMASAMTAEMHNLRKISLLIQSSKKNFIVILPPHINISKKYFFVLKKKIFYGLGAIKGVGNVVIDLILKERLKKGNFLNLFDLCSRIDPSKLTRRVIENLIFSGSLDCFKESRLSLLNSIDHVIKSASQYSSFCKSQQLDLFNKNFFLQSIKKKFYNPKYFNWSKIIELNLEKSVLGSYLTNHPNKFYKNIIDKYTLNRTLIKNISIMNINKFLYISGILLSLKLKYFKKNNFMSILKVEDESDIIDIIIFKDKYLLYKDILLINNLLIFYGKLYKNNYNLKLSILVEKIFLVS